MKKVNWNVDGMTCSNCALSINRVLQKQGMNEISVNPISGNVQFEMVNNDANLNKAIENIELLGYRVNTGNQTAMVSHKKSLLKNNIQRFWFCLPFTIVLMIGHLGMVVDLHILHNPWVQLALCLPVYIVGMAYFGKSAINSLRSGVPNMNVLIALGATAAFVYSIIGIVLNDPSKIFFETAASIITIVFFGNWLEDTSVEKTQKTIKQLTREEKVMANMIAYDEQYNENIFPVENTHLKVGDLLLIKTGEQVPADCKILSGEVEVNESIITGESVPVHKTINDRLIGGSVISNGSVKTYVTASDADSVRHSIVTMMKNAQNQRPPIQLLADKISAIFVPAVIIITIIAFIINFYFAEQSFQESLMRSIAVLVIACPCAMGLATPAAIAVGLGRAAKEGILYTDTKSMELFKEIKQIVFDKTGTLTNGKFVINNFSSTIDTETFKQLVYSLEKISNHPIAKSITEIWKFKNSVRWKTTEEIKGLGIKAEDKEGNIYSIGSSALLSTASTETHDLYVTKNNLQIGWIDVGDEIRPEATQIMAFCKRKGIKTILLSGDNATKCKMVADQLQIDEVYTQQSPQQKLNVIEMLVAHQPTIMVGDGINDAPALAKSTISISLGQASHLAIQTAMVVLMDSGIKKIPTAIQLGQKTYATIKGNLFWAFIYNIVAIPIAAAGLLSPTAGALIMGFSDVVLVINSLWLKWKPLGIK